MSRYRFIALLLAFSLTKAPACFADAEPEKELPKINKLLTMYQLFYLPFALEFQPGRDVDTILPFVLDERGQAARLLEAHELVALDAEWSKIRASWRGKSLLEFHTVPIGKSMRITQRLVSHRLPVTRTALDTIPLSERKAVADSLKGKSAAVVNAFYQLRFIKSLLEPADDQKFNFFVISASWCESSREYRGLLESYFKRFPNPDLIMHSVILDDPKQKVFDSRVLKELFPHPKRYTHETVPRFIAIQTVQGQTKIWEEGEALQELHDRFYAQHRGFLSNEIKALPKGGAQPQLDPMLSSASR